MMKNNLPAKSSSPTRPATDPDHPSADSSAGELLTPVQRNFAQVLGRLLALQWEREQLAPSQRGEQA